MVTIREYYDLFQKYASDKSKADFAEQAVLVGYSQQEVNEILGINTVRDDAGVVNTTPVVNSSANTIKINNPTPLPPKPALTPEPQLPAIILKPSSYIARNKIGFEPLAGPAKSFQYDVKPEAKPIISQPAKIPTATPLVPPITYRTATPRVAEPLVTMASQTAKVQYASKSDMQPNMQPAPKPQERDYQAANQVLNPILNPKTTNVTGIINRSPVGIPAIKHSSRMSSGSKIAMTILIMVIIGGGGFVAYTWLNGGNSLPGNISELIGNKPPYTSANVLGSVFDKLLAQKNIPYLATFSTKFQDKEAGISAFVPSPYEKDQAYARDQKRRDDGYKAKAAVDNFFTTKKRYPKTLAEAGFTTLDPLGKPYGYALTSSTTVVTAASKGKPAVTKVVPGYRITVNFEVGSEQPFSDYYNDLLTFAAKIDQLPKKLAIDSNISGEFNRLASTQVNNSLTIKGPVIINGINGNIQKSVDLQFINYSDSLYAKNSSAGGWIDFERNKDMFSLIGKIFSGSIKSSVWRVTNPVAEKITLSNQLSVQAYRYDVTLSPDIPSLKEYLTNLKSNTDNIDFDYILRHKDIDKILTYIGSAVDVNIWVDSKGEPVKISIITKLAGRVSTRELSTVINIEFGQANPAATVVVPKDLELALSSNGSTTPSLTKFGSLTKDIDLLIPMAAIKDAINSLKNMDTGSSTTSESKNNGLGAAAINSFNIKPSPTKNTKPIAKTVATKLSKSISKPQFEKGGKTMYLYQ